MILNDSLFSSLIFYYCCIKNGTSGISLKNPDISGFLIILDIAGSGEVELVLNRQFKN